jgi:hypothetical protein
MACRVCISNCTVVNEPATGPSSEPHESTPHPRILCSERPTLISSFQMLSSGFMDIVLHEFVTFLMYAACPVHPTLPVLITLMYKKSLWIINFEVWSVVWLFVFSRHRNPFPTVSIYFFRLQNDRKFYVGAKASLLIKLFLFYVTIKFFFQGKGKPIEALIFTRTHNRTLLHNQCILVAGFGRGFRFCWYFLD